MVMVPFVDSTAINKSSIPDSITSTHEYKRIILCFMMNTKLFYDAVNHKLILTQTYFKFGHYFKREFKIPSSYIINFLHKWYLLTYFASLISAIMVLLLKCNLLVQFNAILIMLGC